MKGAIGNAFILNIVITFILIFLLLVVGSMAYTKTYKVKNYLLNEVANYVEKNHKDIPSTSGDKNSLATWDKTVNAFLAGSGYHLATKNNTCPAKNNYSIHINTRVGQYEYCIYRKGSASSQFLVDNYSAYMVLVYMKLDLPVVGDYIKIPITGETKYFYK